jgi:hypothetical protein
MPERIRGELDGAYFGAALRYEALQRALALIADACAALRGPVIVLKGLALAAQCYPSPACRPMEDVDLLVEAADLPDATRALLALGYTDRSFGPEDFRHPETGIVVDLHTELLNTTRLPLRRAAWQPQLERWTARSIPLPLAGPLRGLHPQDHLVYLCHHAWLHHGLRKPLALLDIALLLASSEVSRLGESWLRHPELEPARRGLWYALAACAHQCGAPISAATLRAVRPADTGPAEASVHALAVRGRLPEAARYGFLWLAMPPEHRWPLLRQGFSAWRTAAGSWRRSGAASPDPSREAGLDRLAAVLYHSPPDSPTREGSR